MTDEQLQAAKESAEFSIGEGWPDDDLASITAQNVLVLLEDRAALLAACKAAHSEGCGVVWPLSLPTLAELETAIAKAEGITNG